jgi:hypothetical protein
MHQGKLSILTSVIKNAWDSSSAVACHQDVMVFAVCWLRTDESYVGSFRVDQFLLIAWVPDRSTTLKRMSYQRFIGVFLYVGRTNIKVSTYEV